MKLLQHSWSDMLVLDHMHQRMHNNLPDETTLPNGQKFDLLCLGLLGVPTLADHFNQLMVKLQDLKFDDTDYICVKFLLLLNPGKIVTWAPTSATEQLWPGRCSVRISQGTWISLGTIRPCWVAAPCNSPALAGFLLDFLFDHEDGGGLSRRNIERPPNYIVLQVIRLYCP